MSELEIIECIAKICRIQILAIGMNAQNEYRKMRREYPEYIMDDFENLAKEIDYSNIFLDKKGIKRI